MARAPYPGDLLEHLRSFGVLSAHVERGGAGAYARAAREIAVDVSVLRRRMQTLASWVGAPLVEGRGGALRVTRAGERARELGARALEAIATLPASAGRADDIGPLRVACTGTFLAEVLPTVLARVHERHRALRFRVRREGATRARELLSNDEVDFAIVRGGSVPVGVPSRRLGRDRLWLAARRDSAIASAPRVTLEAIAREPLVGYATTSSTMRRVMDVMRPLGVEPWIEVDGKTAALRYVAAGLGVAFVSLLAGQKPTHPRVLARDVGAMFPPTSFFLVWRPSATLDVTV